MVFQVKKLFFLKHCITSRKVRSHAMTFQAKIVLKYALPEKSRIRFFAFTLFQFWEIAYNF